MIIIKTAVFLLEILRCLFHKPTVLLVFAIRNVWFLLSPSWVFHEVFLVFGTMNARKIITLWTKILLWFSWKALHDPTSIITPPSLPGWPCVKNLHMWHFHFLLLSPPALTTSLGPSCRRAIPTPAAGQEAAVKYLVLSPGGYPGISKALMSAWWWWRNILPCKHIHLKAQDHSRDHEAQYWPGSWGLIPVLGGHREAW